MTRHLDYAIVTDPTGGAIAALPGRILAHNSVRPASALTKQDVGGSDFSPSRCRNYGSDAIADGVRI
jgi:hypothetical protein